MTNSITSPNQFRPALGISWVYSLLFVLLAVGLAYVTKSLAMAVYAVSFWHYYLYWLAYCFGSVSLGTFKWDAIFMKTIGLVGLGCAYLASPISVVSIALVLSGFLLNILAARALGSDRTYYGYEVAGLQRKEVTAFPYSWISHPMLIGNITAFGGTMINADFRAKWWPLACVHVLFNLGLLFMETLIAPSRPAQGRRHLLAIVFGVTGFSIALAYWLTDRSRTLVGAALGASVAGYALLIYGCYIGPASERSKSLELNIQNTL